MRKRDRISLAKQLTKIAEDYHQFVDQQLFGAVWYFEQKDAEIKGYNFTYNSLQSAKHLQIKLDNLWKKMAKKSR